VRDEPAAIPGFAGTPAQVLLQRGERAGKAGELDQRAVHRRRNVRPHDPGPSPGEKGAAHNEADEQQMDDDHEILGRTVPHLVTARLGTSPQE